MVIIQHGKAITLIALVITVIVLLILAGITINFIINGELLQKADNATSLYKEEQENEANNIENVVETIDNINENTVPIDPATANAGDIIKTENNIEYTSDGEGNVIPVPKGFIYTGEGTKETGFVIRNDNDLNEFVWVPVKDMSYTYDRYALLSTQPADGIDPTTNSIKIKNTLNSKAYYTESMSVDEQTSVNTYEGYYIARYEAGKLENKFVVRKSVNLYITTKDGAKTLAEGLYNKKENNVTSKLCSSYAWDTALQFIETKNPGWATNSIGGNYRTSSGETVQQQPTGYHSVNNIYDMGGNVDEWTTEMQGVWCTTRGGNMAYESSNGPASFRNNDANYNQHGFRIALYL